MGTAKPEHILVIADIEGSSGCWNYRASSFLTTEWAEACYHMTLDVNAAVKALFDGGVKQITVKDFHRTGYNLIPPVLDPRVHLVSGYKHGPIPGIGDPPDATAAVFLGMHAASGTNGFLAHTLTSRISNLEVNGRPLPEIELFAASLAPYQIRPLFFSGCPTACRQAEKAISGIYSFPIDKSGDPDTFHKLGWRKKLKSAVSVALSDNRATVYPLAEPLMAVVRFRGGEKTTRKISRRWKLPMEGDRICIRTENLHDLYRILIRICYLTPLLEKSVRFGLPLFNFRGWMGLQWAAHKAARSGSCGEGLDTVSGGV